MFSYYYNNERHTSVDSDYLDELLKDNPDKEEIKQGIIDSYEYHQNAIES